jgi:hypothetical protein
MVVRFLGRGPAVRLCYAAGEEICYILRLRGVRRGGVRIAAKPRSVEAARAKAVGSGTIFSVNVSIPLDVVHDATYVPAESPSDWNVALANIMVPMRGAPDT